MDEPEMTPNPDPETAEALLELLEREERLRGLGYGES